MKFTKLAAALAAAMLCAPQAQAQTEIQWWHSMSGALGDRRERARQQVQRQPEGIQGRPGLQGQPTPSR